MMRRTRFVMGLLGATTLGGCSGSDSDGGPGGSIADKCGLTCPVEGIADGNSSISGVVEIDAFFGAIVDMRSASASVRAGIRADLDAIALSVGLPRGAAGQDIATAVSNRIAADTASGLQLVFEEPVCRASVEVAARAAAECDVDVDPGSATVTCQGACRVEPGAQIDCGGAGELICTGTAPSLQCAGTCTGDCDLEVAAACEGVCRGTCSGNCSVLDGQGNCAGECDAMCQGNCELSAGGACTGNCEGSCAWTPPDSMCDVNVAAKCTATGGGSVACDGTCEGTAVPPMVKAECEAAVQAKADASVECGPPAVSARWQWSAATAADPDAQANFRAWVEIVSGHAASALSKGVKGDIIINGFMAMGEASDGAVRAGAEAALEGDLRAAIGARCALNELPAAASVIMDETVALFDSVQAASTVLAAFE